MRFIEATYRFDIPDDAWLDGVLEALLPFIDLGRGAWAFTYAGNEGEPFTVDVSQPWVCRPTGSRDSLGRSR